MQGLAQVEMQSFLVRFSNISPLQPLTRQDLFSILFNMARSNGYSDFNHEIAQELFDRVEVVLQKPLTLQSISQAFHEADQALSIKVNYMQNQEDDIFESSEFLNRLLEDIQQSKGAINNQSYNYIMLDEIRVQLSHNQYIQPTVIVQIGEYQTVHRVSEIKVGFYCFNLRQHIPISSLMEDLILRVEAQNMEIGSRTLTLESLPHEDIRQATLQLMLNQEPTDNLIILSCQLMVVNPIQLMQFIVQKQRANNEKQSQIQSELQVYADQQLEIRRPFSVYKRESNQQSEQIYPLNEAHQSTQQKLSYRNNFQPQVYETSPPYETPHYMGQDPYQQNNQLHNQMFNQYEYDNHADQAYSTSQYPMIQNPANLHQQQYDNMEEVPNIHQPSFNNQPSDLFSQHTLEHNAKSRPSKPNWTKETQELEEPDFPFMLRVDMISLGIAFIGCLELKRSDFLGCSIMLWLIMSVLRKRFTTTLHFGVLIAVLLLSAGLDVIWLIIYQKQYNQKSVYDGAAEKQGLRVFTVALTYIVLIAKLFMIAAAGRLFSGTNLHYMKYNFLRV